ncbi:hypothetical protein [Paraflavitalea soli]|uniref:hypothetical protein n=1 Tax=Paraflavitalea soli TaxID=2315862 RepID=UPI0013C46541|nr:hypothetical protein [Paraflavitalea soli]
MITTTANIPHFNPAAMISALLGGLLAFVVPTDCLRSLENWPPFHRAFRQYVGNPEAICSPYDHLRQYIHLPASSCAQECRWRRRPRCRGK